MVISTASHQTGVIYSTACAHFCFICLCSFSFDLPAPSPLCVCARTHTHTCVCVLLSETDLRQLMSRFLHKQIGVAMEFHKTEQFDQYFKNTYCYLLIKHFPLPPVFCPPAQTA